MLDAVLREPFSDTVYVSIQHYHDEDDGEPIFFLACETDPKEFARIDSPQVVAVYKLVKTITVNASVQIEDSAE